MLDQTSITGTDDWYVTNLAANLGASFPRLGKLRSYDDGTVTVPDGANQVMRDAYARFVNLGRLNIARLIKSAVTSRQIPVGFRTAAADDVDGDAIAMQQWRKSHMGTQSRDLFDDIAVYGSGYTVGAGDGTILKLSPWNTITDASGFNPWSPDAAIIAVWDPLNQQDVMTLFRPAQDGSPAYTRRAVLPTRTSMIPLDGTIWYPGRGWSWVEDPQPLNWTARIPVVPYFAPGGMGQFEPLTDTLDRINHTIFQRLVIVAMQAFRQRGLIGNLPEFYPEDHPQAGQKINYNEIFAAGPAALWMLPIGAQVWESQVTDITPILGAVDKDLRYASVASSTPLYMLSPDATEGSAEGASLARETLVFKVEDLNHRLDDSFSEAMGLSFAAIGDTVRSDPSQIETIWKPADRASMSEKAAAAAQASTTLPQKTIWREIFQFTPSQIAQAEQDQSDQQFAEPTNAGKPS